MIKSYSHLYIWHQHE